MRWVHRQLTQQLRCTNSELDLKKNIEIEIELIYYIFYFFNYKAVRRLKMGKLIRVLGIIFIILGIIGSIFLGNEYKVKEYNSFGSYEYVFNTLLFSTCAISSSIFGILIMGFGDLITHTEENKANTAELLRYLKMIEENTEKIKKGITTASGSNTTVYQTDILRDIEDHLPRI